MSRVSENVSKFRNYSEVVQKKNIFFIRTETSRYELNTQAYY